ncbi:MAG TPA: IDEAL domain-containing protein [Pseudogracilibacillus sp.]|nr:IDEAL domain-containing protein [Pseudogracilibacillus sp.]
MVTVKLLKPYYIKMSADYIRVILAYQYFSLLINNQVYHFIPVEGKEIRINRKTKQVVNTETKFAFQKGNDTIYITMKKLTSLTDFMDQLTNIVEPYYTDDISKLEDEKNKNIFNEIERDNILRLIDRALDEKDQASFNYLIELL